jgi:two-component system CheB/CheR fusion protein
MFAQVDRSIERSRGGLGIGLNLARGLVEGHGGTIDAASDGSGKGSEFTVRLPALAGEARISASTSKELVTQTTCARRVLVVDDNRDAADSLAELLKTLKHEVATANDGGAALVTAAAFRPDVIVLDIGMPGMSGYELARRIRRQPGLERASLVALTGWGQDQDRQRAREAGIDRHLIKPPDLNVLEEIICSARPVSAAAAAATQAGV